MKAVKIAAVCLLLGVTLFFAVYALLSEQEDAVPVVGYISLEKSEPESVLPSSSSSSSSSRRSSSSRSQSSKSSVSSSSAPPSSSSESSKVSSSSEPSGIELPLNINTATKEELMQLDGVTEEIARLIILYRDLGGGFTEKLELRKIKQISKALYEKIENDIYCDSKDVQSDELQTPN